MSKALSLDLRMRVIAVAGGHSHRQAAEREQGAPVAKALGNDRRSGRIDACKAVILPSLEETPDIMIVELRQTLSERGHCLGFGTIQRFFVRHAITRKKTLHATEQDRPDILSSGRSGSRISVILIRPGWCSSMRRGRRPTWFARTAGRPEANDYEPVHLTATGAQQPSSAPLPLQGVIAPFVLNGPINRLAFEIYVEQVLEPELRPGDIVIMDNISSHKGKRTRELIEAAGASLKFLPPYSPTSILSKTPSPNSRRCYAKQPDEPSMRSGTGLANWSKPSRPKNAPATSPPLDMMQTDRIPL